VAMTANAMQGDRDRCMAAGMNDHVAKPIEPEDLWQALLKWIKPRHSSAAATAVKPPAEQSIELPADIDGLDMVNGLRRVLGNKRLYLSMLRKFVAGQKSAVAEILKTLATDDRDSAERLAHTLKGVSGNIGAGGLQSLAEMLETAIRERRPREELDARVADLTVPLENLINRLEAQLPAEPGQTTVAIDREKLKTVCLALEALLVKGDAEASGILEASSDLLYSAFPNHYRAIESSIRSFDFETALAALRAATRISA